MKRLFFASLFFALIVVGTIASAPANAEKTFVSLRGGFWVTYPDNWRKVDFNEVDMYLMANRAGAAMFDYEAVLSAHDARPFYRGTYMIITFDSLGTLSSSQIDSVLQTLETKFGNNVKYFPVGDFLTDMQTDEPSYDADHELVSIVSDITERQESLKKHLLMMKFFENGIANFYCYAPDTLFDSMKIVFNNIALSLSTDDIDAALQRQTEVDMVPIGGGTVEGGGEVATGDTETDATAILLLIAVVVAMVAVFVLMKQRKKRA